MFPKLTLRCNVCDKDIAETPAFASSTAITDRPFAIHIECKDQLSPKVFIHDSR